MHKSNLHTLLELLRKKARKIRELEDAAQAALDINKDEETYRKKHEEKTNLLIRLPDLARDALEGLAVDMRAHTERGLKEFADDARMALKMDSIFYMSVLLAPEDDKKEGNALEQFITFLEKL
ncbi:MAG: hypothetical protein KAI75_10055 [Desulfobulbaceae bacterium]|nr:hypothetical protein [Desulfobulbaceae bacterium]